MPECRQAPTLALLAVDPGKAQLLESSLLKLPYRGINIWKHLTGKHLLVVAGCPVMSLALTPVHGSTAFVHLGEGNSAGLSCPTGGSVAPVGLEHEGHPEPCAPLAAVFHPYLAVLPTGTGWAMPPQHMTPGSCFFPITPTVCTGHPAWALPGCLWPGRTLGLALLWSAQNVVWSAQAPKLMNSHSSSSYGRAQHT